MVQSDRDVDKAQKQLLDFGYVEWGADDRGPVLDPSKPFMGSPNVLINSLLNIGLPRHTAMPKTSKCY